MTDTPAQVVLGGAGLKSQRDDINSNLKGSITFGG